MSTTPELLDLTLGMLRLVLIASLPAVLGAAVIGLLVGVAQAVTQLQDQSVPFAIKLVAVAVVVAASAGWIGRLYTHFVGRVFDAVSRVV